MPFHIGGLVSGMDTEGMIAQLVSAASRQRTLMTEARERLEQRQGAYGTLRTRLTALRTAVEGMDTRTEFRSVTSSSSDEAAVGVTSDGDAPVGTYSVVVGRLASSAIATTQSGFSATTSTVGAGTLTIGYGTASTTLTVSAGTTLQGLVDQINDGVDGVQAYIMDTGPEAGADRYRMVISGEDTGSDHALSITNGGLSSAFDLTVGAGISQAADSVAWVNGVRVTDADNDLNGVVDGVTFQLYETTVPSGADLTSATPPASSSTITATVGRNIDAMVSNIEEIVTAYNAVTSYIRSQNALDTDAGIRGPFVGETDPRSVRSALQQAIGDDYSAASSVVASLSAIGFETSQNGDISLDTSALRDALNDNFDGVVDMFTDGTNGFAAALTATIERWDDSDDGLIQDRIESLDTQMERQDDRIARFDARMTAYETRLRRQFTAMETAMSRFQSAESSLSALLNQNDSNDD
jgi:flagellar hook-associated protein 2